MHHYGKFIFRCFQNKQNFLVKHLFWHLPLVKLSKQQAIILKLKKLIMNVSKNDFSKFEQWSFWQRSPNHNFWHLKTLSNSFPMGPILCGRERDRGTSALVKSIKRTIISIILKKEKGKFLLNEYLFLNVLLKNTKYVKPYFSLTIELIIETCVTP